MNGRPAVRIEHLVLLPTAIAHVILTAPFPFDNFDNREPFAAAPGRRLRGGRVYEGTADEASRLPSMPCVRSRGRLSLDLLFKEEISYSAGTTFRNFLQNDPSLSFDIFDSMTDPYFPNFKGV